MCLNEMVDAREILTVQRAAKRLGIAPRRLRAAVQQGDLAAYKPGSRWLYVVWSEVLQWLRKQRVAPSEGQRGDSDRDEGSNLFETGAES